MFLKDISVFQALQRNMEWLSARQKVLAQNIANADTPGYKAKDLEKLSFNDLVRGAQSTMAPKATNDGHIVPAGGAAGDYRPETNEAFDKTPNENSVQLEDEIIKVNDTRMSYDLAASLYRKHVQMLKMAITGRPGG